MVSIDDAVIARLSRGEDHFEILVDSDLALKFKRGESVSLQKALAVNDVFKDAKKGEKVSPTELQKDFGTQDITRVAEAILKEGDVQLKTEQRRDMVEEKRKQIATIISKQGMDPRTKLPHPAQRILNAMDQARLQIDPFKPAQEQVKAVLEKIEEIVPISFDKIEVAIKIPVDFAGKAAHIVRAITDIKKEEWKSQSWFAVVEIPAGMQADIYEKLNALTSGRAEVKVMKEGAI